jgi:hypothetical protein
MPVTPSDSPAAPAQYADVAVSSFNIQAPQDDLTAAVNEAEAVAGGPRQAQTNALLSSPRGFATGGYSVDAGYPGTWGTDMEPGVAGP